MHQKFALPVLQPEHRAVSIPRRVGVVEHRFAILLHRHAKNLLPFSVKPTLLHAIRDLRPIFLRRLAATSKPKNQRQQQHTSNEAFHHTAPFLLSSYQTRYSAATKNRKNKCLPAKNEQATKAIGQLAQSSPERALRLFAHAQPFDEGVPVT